MKPPPPLEADIQRTCIDYLRRVVGCLVIRVNSGATVVPATASTRRRFVRANDTPGCSDVLACIEGRLVAIEFKRPGGKLTELQRDFLDSVTDSGGLALCVHSLDELQAALKAEGFAC